MLGRVGTDWPDGRVEEEAGAGADAPPDGTEGVASSFETGQTKIEWCRSSAVRGISI